MFITFITKEGDTPTTEFVMLLCIQAEDHLRTSFVPLQSAEHLHDLSLKFAMYGETG
jgi:hypothetical protein